jgi:hypothetical protein
LGFYILRCRNNFLWGHMVMHGGKAIARRELDSNLEEGEPSGK